MERFWHPIQAANAGSAPAAFWKAVGTIGAVLKVALLLAFATSWEILHVSRLAHLKDAYYLVVSQYHCPQLALFAVEQALPAFVVTGIVPMAVWTTFGARRSTFTLTLLGWAFAYVATGAFTELAFMSHQWARGVWPP
jgi:hypothetical protein